MIESLIYICLYLVGLSVVFIPLELSFKQTKVNIFRKEWITDLFFYLGQALAWNSLTVYTLGFFFEQINFNWLKQIQVLVSEQPFWLRVIEVILLSDLFIYWGHRLQHKYDFLWRFHKVHQ